MTFAISLRLAQNTKRFTQPNKIGRSENKKRLELVSSKVRETLT
jgi:hypothetical protein